MQIIFILILIVAGWFGWRSFRSWLARRRQEAYQEWKEGQEYTLLKILAPKNNEKTPLAAEQMFAALHGIYRDTVQFQDEISFEFASYEKFIHFYIYVPRHLKEFVEGQVYAQYPNVEITEAEDYTQLRPEGSTAVSADLTLTKDDVYPIKTFQNFDVDPLSGITAVLANVGAGEQLWVQLITKPVPENWQEKGVGYVAAKRTGRNTSGEGWFRSFLRTFAEFAAGFLRTAFQPGTSGRESDSTAEAIAAATGATNQEKRVQLSAPEEAALKGIEEKITKLGFQTKIRFVALARDAYTARSRVESLTGAFKQFNSTNLNGFRLEELYQEDDQIESYIARDFTGDGPILNTEELASLYHLPASTVETPNIAWAGSKKGEPPANLPLEGQADEEDTTFYGTTDFRNFKHKFGIKKLDRRLHMYTIGKTGTGKSTLLMNMIIDDIEKGRGVGVVDPHGQLVADILERLPSNRINDVIYFNPADREHPIGFNILENVEPDLRNVVASGVVGIFKKLFAESWGPRLEYILRNTIIALLFYPDTTLLGVNRLLIDDDYRRRVVRKVTDPVVRDFFLEEYNKYDPRFRREAISSIQNKIGQFLSSTTIRNILGQPKSAFDMRKAMDEGKIILMDLSIGKIGEDNTSMLGSLLITKVQLAAMSRADVSEDKRPDFYLYVDEFQNFATESFAVILSEARKYHLNLVLTNQYIGQMPEEVAKAVFGNVGTLVSFRVGSQDAAGLVKEYEPVFEANDLVNLDNYHVYVKMAIDGVTRPAFSAKTLPPIDSIGVEHIEKVIRVSRERFAKPRDLVEKKIQEWSDDVQVNQAREWRKKLQEKEQAQQDEGSEKSNASRDNGDKKSSNKNSDSNQSQQSGQSKQGNKQSSNKDTGTDKETGDQPKKDHSKKSSKRQSSRDVRGQQDQRQQQQRSAKNNQSGKNQQPSKDHSSKSKKKKRRSRNKNKGKERDSSKQHNQQNQGGGERDRQSKSDRAQQSDSRKATTQNQNNLSTQPEQGSGGPKKFTQTESSSSFIKQEDIETLRKQAEQVSPPSESVDGLEDLQSLDEL